MPRTLLGRRPAFVKASRPTDKSSARLAEEIAEALRALAASAVSSNARSAASRGDVDALLGVLDWESLTYRLADAQATTGGVALAEALTGYMAVGGVSVVGAYALTEPRAINFARQQAGALIVEITESVRETVRAYVTAALEEGNNARILASQIRQVIPLHSRYAQAVDNQYQRLFEEAIKAGKTFDEATREATAAAARYAERLLRARAENIARTEIMRASQVGRYEGWAAYLGQPGVETGWMKEWITGGNPCPECDPLDGEIVPWDDDFSVGEVMPPLHPQCRCVGVLRAPSVSAQEGFRKARRDQEHPALIITYEQGATLIASALAVGRTKTREEHEAFVLDTLEEQ